MLKSGVQEAILNRSLFRQCLLIVVFAGILALFLSSVTTHVQNLHSGLPAFNDNAVHNIAVRLALWNPGFSTLFLLCLPILTLYLTLHALILLPTGCNAEAAFNKALTHHLFLLVLALHPLLSSLEVSNLGRRLLIAAFALGILATTASRARKFWINSAPELRTELDILRAELHLELASFPPFLRSLPSRLLDWHPLLVLMVLAAGLRLYDLDGRSMLWDEFAAFNWNKGSLSELLSQIMRFDSHPPLFYLVERVFMYSLGFTIFVSRLPLVLFGVATIPIVYAIGCRLFDQRTAWLAALFATINPFSVIFAQEARMYIMLLFLLTAALLALIVIRERPGPCALLTWMVLMALALLTHYMALPFLFTALLLNLDRRSGNGWKRLTGATILAVIPLTVWGLFARSSPLSGDFTARLTHWLEPPSLSVLATTPGILFDGPFNPHGPFFMALITLLVLPPLAAIFSSPRLRSNLLFLSGWVVIPPVIAFSLSFVLHLLTGAAIYQVKHMIACLPGIFLLLAHFSLRFRRPALQFTVAGSLLLLQLLSLLQYYQVDLSHSWPDAGRQLVEQVAENEPVLVLPDLAAAALETYARIPDKAVKPLVYQPMPGVQNPALTFFSDKLEPADTMHVLLREVGAKYGALLPSDRPLFKLINENFHLIRSQAFAGSPDIQLLTFSHNALPGTGPVQLEFTTSLDRLWLLRYCQETGILPAMPPLCVRQGEEIKRCMTPLPNEHACWQLELSLDQFYPVRESLHLMIDPGLDHLHIPTVQKIFTSSVKTVLLSRYAYIGETPPLLMAAGTTRTNLSFRPSTLQDPLVRLLRDLALLIAVLGLIVAQRPRWISKGDQSP